MRTELTVNGSASPAARYVGWVPVPCQVRLVEANGATAAVAVRLRNQNTTRGGQVIFSATRAAAGVAELPLSLPPLGTPVDVFVAGRFGRPSTADGDAAVEVVEAATNRVLSVTPLMVRVRKDAVSLTTAERNRFLAAYARLNNGGIGKFADFRSVHTNAGDPEAHSNPGFLPWHRAFVLDLERELQLIDPSVALPYWRFDRPARALFSRAFMGVPSATGTVQYNADNPLRFWATDGSVVVARRPQFNTQTQPANVSDELATLILGLRFELFDNMEGDPHGFAHTSFRGDIGSIATAARDPLFFLLHNNVDRLWAKWQWINRRFDPTSLDTYHRPGSAGPPTAARIGHNLNDTMWPWNQVTGTPRPPTAPGGRFPSTPAVSAPGPTPTVRALIDYQGKANPANRLGFDYDDVPFER